MVQISLKLYIINLIVSVVSVAPCSDRGQASTKPGEYCNAASLWRKENLFFVFCPELSSLYSGVIRFLGIGAFPQQSRTCPSLKLYNEMYIFSSLVVRLDSHRLCVKIFMFDVT